MGSPDPIEVRRLFEWPAGPGTGFAGGSWSPDGKYVAFGTFYDIYVVPVALMDEQGLDWDRTYLVVHNTNHFLVRWVSWIAG